MDRRTARARSARTVSEVTDLLRKLFPGKTDEQRAVILQVFASWHGRRLIELEQPHIDTLVAILRYFAFGQGMMKHLMGSVPRPPGDERSWPKWPGVEDACQACRDFKALMLETYAGIRIRLDGDGLVASPITVEDYDSSGEPISADFKDWIIHGGYPREDVS